MVDNSRVGFRAGLSTAFESLVKDDSTLYFITDTNEIYLGNARYALGEISVTVLGSGDVVTSIARGVDRKSIVITLGSAGSLSSVQSEIFSEIGTALLPVTSDITALQGRLNSLSLSSGSGAIEVTGTLENNAQVGLKLDNDGSGNIQFSQSAHGLSAQVDIPAAPVAGVASGDKVLSLTSRNLSSTISVAITSHDNSTWIQLLGISGQLISEVNADSFIVSSLLEDVYLEYGTGPDAGKVYLVMVFITSEGTQVVKLEVTDLVDVYTAAVGGGLTLDNNNAFSITNSVTAETAGLNTGSHPMSFGQSITLNTITYDSHGLITGTGTYTLSLPALDLSSYYTSSEVDTLLSAKQNTLVSGTNIKTINGQSVLGSGNLVVSTYQPFPASWVTNSTTNAFCASVDADSSAVEGMAYLGELYCSDLPFVGNADAVVEIINGSGTSNKVIHIIISSGNVAPYRWEYTYWNSGSSTSGWVGFQPKLTAGDNITIASNVISAQTLTNAEVDIIFDGGYTITANVTNGEASGADKILFSVRQITITPNAGYVLPETITVVGASYTYDDFSGVITLTDATGNVTITVVCESEPGPTIGTLEETSWADISSVSSDGANYFAVGDTKSVAVNGTVGTLPLDTTLYVYILGFNHNSAVEGTGISFGCFKTAIESGVNVALCDSHYGSNSTDGSKWFNMNHSANTNSGGWKGCDMRYDILGSVEVKNQQDATSAATSSPVENTLMAALPSALRAVMKPITKYTDNVGGGTDTAANVTTTVDYLPLLAEKEIFGSRSYANSTEQSHQAQYAFYANGNSKVKYNHSSTSSAVLWWERSAYYDYSNFFCGVYTGGGAGIDYAQYSFGVAPAFLV